MNALIVLCMFLNKTKIYSLFINFIKALSTSAEGLQDTWSYILFKDVILKRCGKEKNALLSLGMSI